MSLTFTIVTPSLNQGSFLNEALFSVKRQFCDKVEHLVIDGGSTDDTVGILRRRSMEQGWAHLSWTSEPDDGQSHALNKGFARAQGDIVGWLNSDDRYRPGSFEYVRRVFASNPEVDVIYGDYTWIDEEGGTLRIKREIGFSRFVLFYHRVLYIPTTTTFLRRRIFEDGNWLDESLHYAMDYEFFLRLASRGYTFLHVPALLGDFRFQRSSKTCRAAKQQLEERDKILRYHSRVLRQLSSPLARRASLVCLRSCAAARRYLEKLIRGYYFDQIRSTASKLRIDGIYSPLSS